MTRRLMSMLVTVLIAGGTVIAFAPGASATRIITKYQGSTVSLKADCAAQGGTYYESPSGHVGVCVRPDGTIMTCDDTQSGQNCNIQGRVITTDPEFLNFIRFGLSAPTELTISPGDGTATSDGKQDVRDLLEQPKFAMPLRKLGTLCGDGLGADQVTSNDGTLSACFAKSTTLFCNSERGKNCVIEKTKKFTRKWLRLLRTALIDPSSVTIVLPTDNTTPSTSQRSTGSTSTSSTSTSTSTSTTTTTQGASIL